MHRHTGVNASLAFRSLPEVGRSMSEFDRHASATPLDLSVFQWNPRLSRRGFIAAAGAAAATAWLAACGGSQQTTNQAPTLGTKLEGTVHLYNWQDYINPDNVSPLISSLGRK